MIFLFIPGIISSGLPDILDAPTSYKIKLNDSVCLPCKVSVQSEAPRKKVLFWWSKQNSTVWNWPRYRVKANKCLRIRNVQFSDQGDYMCYAQNSFGKSLALRRLIVIGDSNQVINRTINEVVVTPMTLRKPAKVFPIPSFLIDSLKRTAVLVEKSFYVGRRGKLKCAVEGSPPPIITWYKADVLLKNSKDISIREKIYSLIIRKFDPSDIGKYTCVAENGAGKVNMSFIVKQARVINMQKPPAPVRQQITVKAGSNVTLKCHSPANRVKLMQWHLPKKVPRVDKTIATNVLKDLSRGPFTRRVIKEPKVVNSSRYETFRLFNVSKHIHAGDYKCLVLYKQSKKPFTVKIVTIKFEKEEVEAASQTSGSTDQSTLILFIGIPVFAGVLSMVLAIICIRCYRYHKKRVFREKEAAFAMSDEEKYLRDEDDALSMQILPAHYPTNSLRINKSSLDISNSIQQRSRSNSLNQKESYSHGMIKDSYVTENGTTALTGRISPIDLSKEREINSNTIERTSLYSSKKDLDKVPVERTCAKTDLWPGKKLMPGDLDFVDFNDDECLVQSESFTSKKPSFSESIDNKKQNKRKKRKYKSSREKDASAEEFLPPCQDINDKVPSIEMCVSAEDEDLLLQREMKNWEPLIRNSTRLKDSHTRCANDIPQL